LFVYYSILVCEGFYFFHLLITCKIYFRLRRTDSSLSVCVKFRFEQRVLFILFIIICWHRRRKRRRRQQHHPPPPAHSPLFIYIYTYIYPIRLLLDVIVYFLLHIFLYHNRISLMMAKTFACLSSFFCFN
jgi:hypothetical protein